MNKIVSTIKDLILIALICVICFMGFKLYNFKNSMFTKGETTYSNEIIEEKISELSELITLEYFYTNSEKSDEENVKLFNWSIPFTGKYLIVKYDGIIKYSVDMSKANTNLSGETLTITIPHSTISSHEIDEASFQYLEEKSGLFNPIKLEDGDKIRQQSKDTMEKRASELKLSDQADENAVKQLKQFIEGLFPELKVEVVFD